jgi:hypothetical protein
VSSFIRFMPLVAGLLAAGCVNLTEAECRGTNWYERGEQEALIYGLRPQIDIYTYQCSRFGVQVPEQDYMSGWQVGQGERIRRAAGEGCCAPH